MDGDYGILALLALLQWLVMFMENKCMAYYHWAVCEAYDIGLKNGRSDGLKHGWKSGYKHGWKSGYKHGLQEGQANGFKEGQEETFFRLQYLDQLIQKYDYLVNMVNNIVWIQPENFDELQYTYHYVLRYGDVEDYLHHLYVDSNYVPGSVKAVSLWNQLIQKAVHFMREIKRYDVGRKFVIVKKLELIVHKALFKEMRFYTISVRYERVVQLMLKQFVLKQKKIVYTSLRLGHMARKMLDNDLKHIVAKARFQKVTKRMMRKQRKLAASLVVPCVQVPRLWPMIMFYSILTSVVFEILRFSANIYMEDALSVGIM